MTSTRIRSEAQTGFAAAAAYDTGRPTYSAEAVDLLLEKLGVKGVQGAKILDLAAGTGKFTEALSARPEAYQIVAVEPHDDMRRQLLTKQLRGVEVIDGTAEDLGLADGTFAAITVAQSFHWFANMKALKEMARVLRPAGVLGLIWNIDDYNAPKSWDIHGGWGSTMRDVVWSFEDDQPRFRHEQWRKIFDEQTSWNPLSIHFTDPVFSLPIGETSMDFETLLLKDDIWKRLRTLSQLAILEGLELEKVEKTFDEAIDKDSSSADGKYSLYGRTVMYWTSQIPEVPLGTTQ